MRSTPLGSPAPACPRPRSGLAIHPSPALPPVGSPRTLLTLSVLHVAGWLCRSVDEREGFRKSCPSRPGCCSSLNSSSTELSTSSTFFILSVAGQCRARTSWHHLLFSTCKTVSMPVLSSPISHPPAPLKRLTALMSAALRPTRGRSTLRSAAIPRPPPAAAA